MSLWAELVTLSRFVALTVLLIQNVSPFQGHGLSYSTWEFRWSASQPPFPQRATPAAIASGKTTLRFSVDVHNTGDVDSDMSVLAFVNATLSEKDLEGLPSPPIRQLFNFTRVHVRAGAQETVEMSMEPELLALTNYDGVRAVRSGAYTVAIGGVGRAGRVEDGAVSGEVQVERGEPAVLFSMAALRAKHDDESPRAAINETIVFASGPPLQAPTGYFRIPVVQHIGGGVVLAFAEDRYKRGDGSAMQIAMRRSSDSGTAPCVCPVAGTTFDEPVIFIWRCHC